MTTTTATRTATTATQQAAPWPALAPFEAEGATRADMLAHIRALEEHRVAALKAYAATQEDMQHFRALALGLQGIPAR